MGDDTKQNEKQDQSNAESKQEETQKEVQQPMTPQQIEEAQEMFLSRFYPYAAKKPKEQPKDKTASVPEEEAQPALE